MDSDHGRKTNQRNPILNQQGFTLVEVVVSVVIGLLIAGGLLVSIQNISMGSKVAETRLSLTSNTALLQKVLSNIQICTNGIDKTVPVPINFAAPSRFDVSFDLVGFGTLKKNFENTVVNYFIDELYVDNPVFYGVNSANQKIFIGILKLSATERIVENSSVRKGLSYKNKIVGAISLTLKNDKTIVDCKTSPRSLKD